MAEPRRPNGRLARLARGQEAGRKAALAGEPPTCPLTVPGHRAAWRLGYLDARNEMKARK